MSGVRATGTPHRLPSSAASNNATSVRTKNVRLVQIMGYNSNAAARYLKLYNKASAPTVGTDTPFLTIALPPQTAFSMIFEAQEFPLGLGYGLVTGAADADNTGVGAGDILGLNILMDKDDA